MANQKPTLSRPKDESLESFKAWITELTARITGNKGGDGSITEDDWIRLWKEFWNDADKAIPPK